MDNKYWENAKRNEQLDLSQVPSKPIKRRKVYIKWDNIFAILSCIFLGLYAFGILDFNKDTAISQQNTDSSMVIVESDSSKTEASSSAIKSSDASKKDESSVTSKSDVSKKDESSTKPMVITFSEDEINTIVLSVQHEVGKNPDLYKNPLEFDYLQQLMTASIINRIGKPGFADDGYPNNLNEVLDQEGQYKRRSDTGEIVESLLDDISHYWELENKNQFDPNDPRTRANVLKVLNGEVSIPDVLVYERCSLGWESSPEEAWEFCRNEIYSASPYVNLYASFETNYGTWIMFGTNETGTAFAYPVD